MRRAIITTAAVLALTLGAAAPAFAGHPHFVSVSATRTDNSLSVTFKEAGLGDEPTVNITVSATAECINGGGKHPKATNKQSLSTSSPFNVNNGQASGTLTLTATFKPDCSPPMSVVFTKVSITDSSNHLTENIAGTF